MGGTSSKSTSEILTQISVEASMNSILSCTSAATQSQLIELGYVAKDVIITGLTMKQSASVDSKCVMEAKKVADISTAVSNAIAQYAESKGQAVLSSLGNTKSEVVTKLTNDFKSRVDANTAQQMTSIVDQQQGTKIKSIGGSYVLKDATFEQGAQVTAQALMSTNAFSSVINETATKIDQVSKTQETTIFTDIANAIKNFFLSAIGLIVAAAVFIVIVLIIIVL
jgi:23S rRNA pseudoU1915 N3-methylase RlmH